MARATTRRTVIKARELRREMTLPEVLLWRVLKARPEGFKFRRQHPVGAYVLDFYCPEAKLGFEIDGIAHDMGDAPEHDAARTEWLREHGIAVVRIPAGEVLQSVEQVAATIVTTCQRSK